MANGIPLPWEGYAALPYHYPLVDQQPVVRIPVIGPEPFNTLVVVRGRFSLTDYRKSDGKLHQFKWALPTNFSLIGFDPRVPPPSRHSTTVTLQMLQVSGDTNFAAAADAVDQGYFDDTGRWTVVVRVASEADQVYAAWMAYLSSWVLCFEPPPNPDLPRDAGRRASAPLSHTTRAQLLEMDVPDPTEAGRHLEEYVKKSQRQRLKQREAYSALQSDGQRPSAPVATAETFSSDANEPPAIFPGKPSPAGT
jgi:hypothetical protein